jgi:hypothetical protein
MRDAGEQYPKQITKGKLPCPGDRNHEHLVCTHIASMKFIIRGMFAHGRKWLLMTKQLSPGANSLRLRFCGKWCETGKLITAENSNPLAEEIF